MSDVRNLVERLRQIAESQRMDLDSPNVAATLDDAATTLEALASIGSVVAEEPEWEYGWHTGSTVSLIGRRDQVEEWLAVRGWKLGEGDWGSRVMRRRVAGSWVPAEQEGAEG